MEKKIFILILILLALPLTAQAAITCTAKADCSGAETAVLGISDGTTFTNSHAAVPSAIPAGYGKICCSGIKSAACGAGSAKIMLRLSGNTNAHAEGPAEATAGYTDVCIDSDGSAQQLTGITLRNWGCNTGETCIVALSDVTNAHLAQCSVPLDPLYPQTICASQATGSLIIEKIVVPNPAYKGQPMNVDVTIAKAAAGTEALAKSKTAELSDIEGKTAYLAINKEGTISVQFVNPPAPMPTKTADIMIDDAVGRTDPPTRATYDAADLDSLNPGIYTLLIEVFDSDGTAVASQIVNFALANPPSTASVPETNWLGAIIVAACVFTIVFVVQRKSPNPSN
ncbi:MAG: hypothetical protein PHD95_03970 [Candidatus ainarchaeum sp.]|nr:hypothetical protein [Candidatus ainarchaeum sp.]